MFYLLSLRVSQMNDKNKSYSICVFIILFYQSGNSATTVQLTNYVLSILHQWTV